MFTKINSEISERLSARREGEKGFTLVELLVVVIIIGILAAIAIPVFLGQREAAWKSSVESDLRSAALALETYAAENNGSLGDLAADDASITTLGLTVSVSPDNTINTTITGNSYVLVGSNSNIAGETLTYDSEAGGIDPDGWAE